MPDSAFQLRLDDLHALTQPLGFAMVGVTPAQATARAALVQQWLAENRHGEMAYLANHLPQRLDPRVLVPGARSVICVADLYHAQAPRSGPEGDAPPSPRGRIARYAWGDDYHKVMKRRLHALADALRERFPDHEYKAAVDTAPVLEREHASRAGLGWTGKHTLLIHPRLGSYLLLGEIVTTLDIEPSDAADHPLPLVPPADHCGTCRRCLDACPTRCIDEQGYTLDATRCISYLTLEHRSTIDAALHESMGDWIAGCDVCQEVCPHNRPSQTQREETQRRPEYAPRDLAHGLGLLAILNWTAEDRQRVFAGSALKRIKLEMLKRNALIAACNYLREHEDASLLSRIEELARDDDADPLVRDTARQVLARLSLADRAT